MPPFQRLKLIPFHLNVDQIQWLTSKCGRSDAPWHLRIVSAWCMCHTSSFCPLLCVSLRLLRLWGGQPLPCCEDTQAALWSGEAQMGRNRGLLPKASTTPMCQLYTKATLEITPLASVKPSGDHSPDWYLACNLVRDLEPAKLLLNALHTEATGDTKCVLLF